MTQPKKWTEVYPYGTKEGDEEAKFFKALARNQKYEFRSIGALVKTTGLSQKRVEEIIDKYLKFSPPLIYPHPTNDDHWGYWERCPDVLKKDKRGISDKDKDNRIDNHMSGTFSVVTTDYQLPSGTDFDATSVDAVIYDIKTDPKNCLTFSSNTTPMVFVVDASPSQSGFCFTEMPNVFTEHGWRIIS